MASWKSLTGVPAFTPDTMLLLTDGSVLVHDLPAFDASGNLITGTGTNWYRLKPDNNGNYNTAGTGWSGPFSMANGRQFFASGILGDGRVFVLGGEYSDDPLNIKNTPLGEIFDPQTNTWSPMNKPAVFNWINGDVSACILADGRVLFGELLSNRTVIWDPIFDPSPAAWTEAGKAFGTLSNTTKNSIAIDEETWALMPDGTVLTVDISSVPIAERYVPTIDQWVVADQTPATLTQNLALISLQDTTVNPNVTVNIGEVGPAILLPDGRLFFIGATGHTALYTPPAIAAQPGGSWSAGPDLPPDTSGKNFNSPNGNIQTAIDAPALLLPNGKVLLVGGDTVREGSAAKPQFWSNPSRVFIYDPTANTITPITSQPPSNGVDTWKSRFLLLPNAQVMMTTEQSKTITILTDPTIIGTPNPTWKPVITAFTPVMAVGHHYKISGKQINGLSQACCYGDDAQMGTNYPLARFTNTGTGTVSYFRTFDFSTLGVATENAIHSTLVEIPASATPGNYSIQVVANGIASDPVNVNIVPVTPAIAVNLQDDLLFGIECNEPQFLSIEVFNVGGANLIVDSVAWLSGSLDFTVLANPVSPLTISPGDHVDFTVRFTPTTRGILEAATIRISSNDPVTPHFDLTTSGTWGTGSLEIVVADNGNVGDVCVGEFVDAELIFINNGPCRLSIFDISSLFPLEFEVPTVLSYPFILGVGDSMDIPIRFHPTSFGSKFTDITVTSDDLASPKVIRLFGNAPAPRLVSIIADTGNFGNVCIDSFVDKPLTLSNAGHCSLIVNNIISSLADFIVPNISTLPFTVEEGNAIELPIRFQPTSFGSHPATITIFSNDPGSPHSISVLGNAPSGKLAVTGSTNFGEVDCGIAEKTVSICNVGDCKLHVTSVAFSRKRRHFKLINNPFPAMLHPGSCLGVVIQYRASCEPECCELVIHSNDPHQPVKVLDVVAYTRCERKCACDDEDRCCSDHAKEDHH